MVKNVGIRIQKRKYLRKSTRGLRQTPRGLRQTPRGLRQTPRGIKANPEGIKANPEGIKANPEGIKVIATAFLRRKVEILKEIADFGQKLIVFTGNLCFKISLLYYMLHSANFASFEAHFDSVGMQLAVCEDSGDDALCEFARSLMLL
jgi:hypothetical protein